MKVLFAALVAFICFTSPVLSQAKPPCSGGGCDRIETIVPGDSFDQKKPDGDCQSSCDLIESGELDRPTAQIDQKKPCNGSCDRSKPIETKWLVAQASLKRCTSCD